MRPGRGLRASGGRGAQGARPRLLQAGGGWRVFSPQTRTGSIPRPARGRLLAAALLSLLLLLPFLPLLFPFILFLPRVPSHECQGALFTHGGFGVPVLKTKQIIRKTSKCCELTGTLLEIRTSSLGRKGQAAIKLGAVNVCLVQILSHLHFCTVYNLCSTS